MKKMLLLPMTKRLFIFALLYNLVSFCMLLQIPRGEHGNLLMIPFLLLFWLISLIVLVVWLGYKKEKKTGMDILLIICCTPVLVFVFLAGWYTWDTKFAYTSTEKVYARNGFVIKEVTYDHQDKKEYWSNFDSPNNEFEMDSTVYLDDETGKYVTEVYHDWERLKGNRDNAKLPGVPRQFGTFARFIDYLYADSISFTPAGLKMLSRKTSGGETSWEFEFLDKKLGLVRKLNSDKGDNPCDSLFSYYAQIDNKTVYEIALPDSAREWGMGAEFHCGFKIVTQDAKSFQLGGLTYLRVSSSISECTGSFCQLHIDHFFRFNGNDVSYFTTDGTHLCDLNKDGQPDQIVLNDNAADQEVFKEKLKGRKDLEGNTFNKRFMNICVWTLENGKWLPLKDKAGLPYFVFIGFEWSGHDAFRILDQHWIKKI